MKPDARSCASPRALLLLVVGWALLAALVVYSTLFAPSYFEDDRYNLGVVRRSALPTSQHLLETSLVGMFFEPYPVPRAEDWHIGLPIVLLVGWTKLVGPTPEWVLRLPHLIWVSLWFFLAALLLQTLRRPVRLPAASDGGGERVTFAWLALAVGCALALTPWAHFLLSHAFVEDVPAAVAVLVLLLLLARSRTYGLKTALAAGALAGLAFVMKDLYIVWGPIGLLLTVALVGQTARGPRPRLLRLLGLAAVLFVAAYLVVVLPKSIWRWHEVGGPLENPVRYWLSSVFFYHSQIDPAHHPFFLYDDDSYRSVLTLAGGLEPALAALKRPVLLTLLSLQWLAPAWLWLIPFALWRRLLRHWSQPHLVLYTALALTIAAYCAFFMSGLAWAGELRSWIVPVTLAVALGIQATAELVTRGPRGGGGWRRGDLQWVAPLLFVILLCYVQPATILDWDRADAPPIDASTADRLATQLPPAGAALLDIKDGINFWSEHPWARVVAFSSDHLVRLSPPLAQRLVDTYDVQAALLRDRRLSQPLEAIGFVVVYEDDRWVLLARGPSTPP
ncbi:MAG TPA: hypothetical protein VII06_33460 [Chloroflexota bacterium]|jgi:hypothetical protein